MTDEYSDRNRPVLAPSGARTRPPWLVSALVVDLGLLAVLIWQFAGVPNDGPQFQVLDPELFFVWKAVLVALLVDSIACRLAVWMKGRWTIALAVVNSAVDVVAAAVIIALTAEGELFSPNLPQQIAGTFGTTSEWSWLTEPFIVVVGACAIWDGVDGCRQAAVRRGSSAVSAAGPGTAQSGRPETRFGS